MQNDTKGSTGFLNKRLSVEVPVLGITFPLLFGPGFLTSTLLNEKGKVVSYTTGMCRLTTPRQIKTQSFQNANLKIDQH